MHNWCARGALREQGETKQPIRNVPEANRELTFINAAEAEGMEPPMDLRCNMDSRLGAALSVGAFIRNKSGSLRPNTGGASTPFPVT